MSVIIPFVKVLCDGNELKYVREVLDSGWLTTAEKTHKFEKEFAEYVGAKYACAVNSCTAALHLALDALGVGPGSKVFVPTMTFTATAEVVRYLGGDPIFLDVDYSTALVTPEILARAVAAHPEVKTFIPVHYGGQAAEMVDGDGAGLLSICQTHGIRIVEDAAHAFPTRCAGRMIGSIGDVTCFSFYANKTITTAEGGMLTTNDEAVAKKVKIMRLHGIDRDIWERFTSTQVFWEYDVVAPGYKYNMSDVSAAIGLAQMERAEIMREERERCAGVYFRRLSEIRVLDLPDVLGPMKDHAWHLFSIVLKPDAPVSRNRFIELMGEAGIGTSVHYKPLHWMTYYRERYNLREDDYPQAERRWRGCVSLPIYPSLRDDELDYICYNIKNILA